LHLLDAHTVHARCAVIAGHLVPRRPQHVGPVDPVIQGVKPKPRLPLGFPVPELTELSEERLSPADPFRSP
jgi:hypothetical protein